MSPSDEKAGESGITLAIAVLAQSAKIHFFPETARVVRCKSAMF
jgi:hypothetical protein